MFKGFCGGMIVLVLSVGLCAADATDMTDKILIEQQKIRNSIETLPTPKSRIGRPAKLSERLSTANNEQRFLISSIEVAGVTQIHPIVIRYMVMDYEGKELGYSDINQLTSEITNMYLDRGFVTSRAYIPAQNIASGNLKITVVEGVVTGIEWGQVESQGKLVTAFPHVVGKVLSVHDIEQGLDQINRSGIGAATVEIVPDGLGSKVIVYNPIPTDFVWEAAYNNTTSYPASLFPNSLLLRRSNLLGINDLAVVQLSLLSGQNGQYSHQIYAATSLPWGYLTFHSDYSLGQYLTVIYDSNGDLVFTGKTEAYSGLVNAVLFRDLGRQLSVSTGLTRVRSHNYLGQVRLDARDTELLTWQLKLDGHVDWGLFWSGSVMFERGLDIGGANVDPDDISVGEPHSQFDKFSGTVAGFKQFSFFNIQPQISTTTQWQTASVTLPPLKRMALGDVYSVRAYSNYPISGDRGAYMRNELQVPFNQFPNATLVAGIDAGYTNKVGGVSFNGETGDGYLVGGFYGYRWRGTSTQFEVFVGIPLAHSDYVEADHNIIGFQLKLSN